MQLVRRTQLCWAEPVTGLVNVAPQDLDVGLVLYTQTGVRYVPSCYGQNLLFLMVETRIGSTLEGL